MLSSPCAGGGQHQDLAEGVGTDKLLLETPGGLDLEINSLIKEVVLKKSSARS